MLGSFDVVALYNVFSAASFRSEKIRAALEFHFAYTLDSYALQRIFSCYYALRRCAMTSRWCATLCLTICCARLRLLSSAAACLFTTVCNTSLPRCSLPSMTSSNFCCWICWRITRYWLRCYRYCSRSAFSSAYRICCCFCFSSSSCVSLSWCLLASSTMFSFRCWACYSFAWRACFRNIVLFDWASRRVASLCFISYSCFCAFAKSYALRCSRWAYRLALAIRAALSRYRCRCRILCCNYFFCLTNSAKLCSRRYSFAAARTTVSTCVCALCDKQCAAFYRTISLRPV